MTEIDYQRLIDEGVDLSDQVRDANIYPSEQVLSIETTRLRLPDRHLSAIRSVLGLTDAPRMSEIGLHGPSNAANATEANTEFEELKLYEVFFPRDGHVVAKFLYDYFPELTRATIKESLKYTGVRDNLRTDGLQDEQEYGKIPHEIRNPLTDSIARKLSDEKNWGWPYYGAVDTTGKNINAIVRVASDDILFLNDTFIGQDGEEHTIEEGLRANINWVLGRMDLNQEGLVEMLFMNPRHHANQAWDDSPEAYHHADGTWARHHPDKNWGVASLGVQVEAFQALTGAARIYSTLADEATGTRKKFLQEEIRDLTARAEKLRQVILDKFWVEDPYHFGGYFAGGTDRDENGNMVPMATRKSAMGSILGSGILREDDPEDMKKQDAVIRNLFSEEMLCPSGIRTLSSDSKLYSEERYHCGNAWLWESYDIARNLDSIGYNGLGFEVKKRVWSVYNDTGILPEFASGSADPKKRLIERRITVFDPTLAKEPIHHFSIHQIFQAPQEIQAWTAAALLAMKYEYGSVKGSHRAKPVPRTSQDPEKRAIEQEIVAGIK